MHLGTPRKQRGFTLIELMITVAIIGILSSVAIPSFQLFMLRSKRAEATSNLANLRETQLAYFHGAGRFLPAAPSPGLVGQPSANKQNWKGVRPGFSSAPGTGFDVLGFSPEGATYFDYDTNALLGAGWSFTAGAYGDLDGDGSMSAFLYVYPDTAGTIVPSLTLPALTVPWNPSTCQPLLNTVARVPSTAGCGFNVADDF